MFRTDSLRLHRRRTTTDDQSDSLTEASSLIVDWPPSRSQDSNTDDADDTVNSNNSTTRSRSTVTFSIMTRVNFFDVCETEKESRWYSKSDYASFKSSIKTTALAVRKATNAGKKISCVKRCFRGIEFACNKNGIKIREEETRAVIKSVLAEQERQRTEGTCHTLRMASVSIAASEKAREISRCAGIADARAAYKVHYGKERDLDAENNASTSSPIQNITDRLSTLREAAAVAHFSPTKTVANQQNDLFPREHVNSSPRTADVKNVNERVNAPSVLHMIQAPRAMNLNKSKNSTIADEPKDGSDKLFVITEKCLHRTSPRET